MNGITIKSRIHTYTYTIEVNLTSGHLNSLQFEIKRHLVVVKCSIRTEQFHLEINWTKIKNN